MAIGTITVKCRWIPSEAIKCTACGKEGSTLKTQTQCRKYTRWEDVPGIALCEECFAKLPETPPDPTENDQSLARSLTKTNERKPDV